MGKRFLVGDAVRYSERGLGIKDWVGCVTERIDSEYVTVAFPDDLARHRLIHQNRLRQVKLSEVG